MTVDALSTRARFQIRRRRRRVSRSAGFIHTAPSSMGKYMRSVMNASMSPGFG